MSNELKLSILSPERKLVEKIQVVEVMLTGSEGLIEVLPGHAPMIGSLQTGMFQYKTLNKDVVVGAISTGFFYIKDNEVNVLAETLELKGEIDLVRAKKAQKLAEDTLSGAGLEESQFKKYQLKLQRSIIRQQIVSSESH